MTREYTAKLLQMIDDGMLDKDMVISAFAQYLSEDEVREMMYMNDMIDDIDEYDDSMDGDFDTAMSSAGMGTDEDYNFYGV
jgi:hypothetical protein